MMTFFKNKKNIFVLLVITSILLLGSIIILTNKNKKPSSSNNPQPTPQSETPTSTPRAEVQIDDQTNSGSLEYFPSISILPQGYTINNNLIPMEQDGYTRQGNKWTIIPETYCQDRQDKLLCDIKDQTVYIDLIVNKDKKVLIKQLTINPNTSEVGEQFLRTYRELLSKNKKNIRCDGGMLFDQEKKTIVYLDVDEGNGKEDVYTLLDSVKSSKNMEYFFRCDQLDKF